MNDKGFNISPEVLKEPPIDIKQYGDNEIVINSIKARKNIWYKNEIYTPNYNTLQFIKKEFNGFIDANVYFLDAKLPIYDKDLDLLHYILKEIKYNIVNISKEPVLVESIEREFERFFKRDLSDIEKEDIFYNFFKIITEYKIFIFIFLPDFDKYKSKLKSSELELLRRISENQSYQMAIIISTGYFSNDKRDMYFDALFQRSVSRESYDSKNVKDCFTNLSLNLDGIELNSDFKQNCTIFFGNQPCLLDNFQYDFIDTIYSVEHEDINTLFRNYIENKYYMKQLTTEEFKELQTLLMDIYTSSEELAIFVRLALNENINVFAGGTDLRNSTFKLLTWAEAKSRIVELVEAFEKDNTNNIEVQELVKRIGIQNKNVLQQEVEVKGKDSRFNLIEKTNESWCFITSNPNGSYSVDPNGQLTAIQSSGYSPNPEMNVHFNKVGEKVVNFSHIHITVHGAKNKLYFEHDRIEAKEAEVPTNYLVLQLKENCKDIKELIVLVSCQSAEIAEQLVKEKLTKAAIGTTIRVSPKGAVDFTRVFYKKLQIKPTIIEAFESACIELNYDPEREEYDSKDEKYDYTDVFKLYLSK